MAKKYVPIFFDWAETTVDLSQEQKGNLIDSVVDYASERRSMEDILSGLSGIERVAFRFLKGQVDRFEEVSAVRSRAGSSKPNQNESNDIKPQQKPANESKPQQKFVKPTVQEVAAYCKERGNNVDPEAFVAFYESKGWRVGAQPMKSWKACIVTWEKRDDKPKQQTKTVVAQQYSQRDYSTDLDYKAWEEQNQRELEERIRQMEEKKKKEAG